MTMTNFVYLLYIPGTNRTYIGATNDPAHRLRQHNGEIAGGAKATRGRQWTQAFTLSGFPDWRATLQFEWAWKYNGRKKPGLRGKIAALKLLLAKPAATANAVPFAIWPSKVTANITPLQLTELQKIDTATFLLETQHTPTMLGSAEDIALLRTQVTDLLTEVTLLQQRYNELQKKVEGTNPKPAKEKKPKKRSAYMNFSDKKRKESPETKFTMKQLSEQWKALTDEQKKSYETI